MRIIVGKGGKVMVPAYCTPEQREQIEKAVAEILSGAGELVEFDDDDNRIAQTPKD